MIALQTIGILLCVLFLGISGAALVWAVRADAADAHLAHKPGTCNECDES